MNPQILEEVGAVIAGIVVAIVAFYALYVDWKTPGVENNVFKIMLFLLGLGAVLALLAALHIVGFQPKGA